MAACQYTVDAIGFVHELSRTIAYMQCIDSSHSYHKWCYVVMGQRSITAYTAYAYDHKTTSYLASSAPYNQLSQPSSSVYRLTGNRWLA